MANQTNIGSIQERPMVDIAYDLLKNKGDSMIYSEIMKQVATQKGFSQSEQKKMMAQLYTEINIDGRFVCVGRNLWGLKHWFPLEQSSDSAVAANVKEDDYAEEEIFDEDENEDTLQDKDRDEAFDSEEDLEEED